MTKTFEEVQDVLPKNSFIAMILVFVSTDVFILMTHFIESLGTPLWMFAVASVVFAALIAFCILVKLRIVIEDNVLHIRFIKSYVIPFGDIIDYKTGDVSIIRNYSGWGMKKVTFKNLICIGYDEGASLKLMGRRVITISLSDPEGFASLLPSGEGKL
jgi:hypothetical protein